MQVNPARSLFQRLHAAWHQRAILLKAASFAAVGVINSTIDFAVFWTLVQYFNVPIVPANVTSWVFAVSNSYVLNTHVTFAHESGRQLRWRAYATFLGSCVLGLIASTVTLVVMFEHVMPRLLDNPKYQLAIAKFCAMAVSFVVNFSLTNFVVFGRRRAQQQSQPRP
jgi:putative flippase GtrA